VVDSRQNGLNGGRSADISSAWRVGASTTVKKSTATVVDLHQ
jgi:hypothetical protein